MNKSVTDYLTNRHSALFIQIKLEDSVVCQGLFTGSFNFRVVKKIKVAQEGLIDTPHHILKAQEWSQAHSGGLNIELKNSLSQPHEVRSSLNFWYMDWSPELINNVWGVHMHAFTHTQWPVTCPKILVKFKRSVDHPSTPDPAIILASLYSVLSPECWLLWIS